MKLSAKIKDLAKNILYPFSYCISKILSKTYPLNISNSESTLKFLLNEKKSISRFGDGEFCLIFGKSIPFQEASDFLSNKLIEVLQSAGDNPSHIVAIPYAFSDIKELSKESKKFWAKYLLENYIKIYQILTSRKHYYDSQITRIYINRADKSKSKTYFSLWKSIWNDEKILVVEGVDSRFGVGNDLFNNVNKIERILCPNVNAFAFYEEIKSKIIERWNGHLVLLVLGPSATVLAYELALKGIRTIDIGNLDMEYEWYKRNVDKRVTIPGKHTIEIEMSQREKVSNDDEYSKQVIALIRCS